MAEYSALSVLRTTAQSHNDHLAALSVAHLPGVKQDFDRLGIDTSPYYRFTPPEDLGFTARAVIVVAAASPVASVAFNADGEKITVTIPPSYVDADKEDAVTLQYLRDALHGYGYAIAPAGGLPCKPIAVHAGLGVYGRNNLLYVEGMGSLLRLFLFFSDLPCPAENFTPLRRHPMCRSCDKCVSNCPSAALNHTNELVDADRCLCAVNESKADFPEWIKPEWHHAMIGCMRCQDICPINQPYLQKPQEIASYSTVQTLSFLRGELPEERLAVLGMGWYSAVLPRNLMALLPKNDRSEGMG